MFTYNLKEISNENRAYFAGLLDGEGTIVISKSIKKEPNNSVSYGLRVRFGLTYKKILLEMQGFFGGNIHEANMNKRMNCKSTKNQVNASPDIWKQVYDYQISGRDALYFLKVVEPFCREKKEQAALGIRFEDGKRPFSGRHGRSESETQRCEFFYRELQRMKHEQLDEIGDNVPDFEDNQQKLVLFVEEK